MKLGVYLDMRNPPPWRSDWAELYAAAIDLVAEAESRGCDAVWLTEHHGFDDGYLSQPLAFAAALAVRTHTIRIGTGVVLAPLRHPVHLAEEAALVDVLSNGRLELGLGAGYVRAEFETFGADESRRYVTTADAVRQLRTLFGEGGVRPGPVQAEIPLWLGYLGPRGAEAAGSLDVGLLSLDRTLLPRYEKGRRDAGLDGPGRTGGVVNMLLARDPDRAAERLLPHLAYHLNSYRQAIAAGRGTTPPRILEVDELRHEYATTGIVRGYRIVDCQRAVGQLIELSAGAPVEHVFFWARIGGMPDAMVEEHLDVLLREVAPALAAAGQPT